MIFQTGLNPKLAETVFRSCLSSVTATTTLTAASAGLGIGMPIILATATASANGYHVAPPSTASVTTPENNLYIGNLHYSLGSSDQYLAGEDAGLVQVYGYDSDAKIGGSTASAAAGAVLVPDLGYGIVVGSPVTAAATATAAHGTPWGLGGLAVLMQDVATKSATTVVSTAKVFLRCM